MPSSAALPIPVSEERMVYVRQCETSGLPIQLCYQTFGDDSCPPVVLIGGLNMQMFAWDEKLCEALASSGFFIIRFDNRDIGYSTKIENCGSVIGARLLLPKMLAFGEQLPYTIEDMALDVIGMLDALSINAAHFVGVSMGGMIAQSIALLAPTRTLSLASIMSTTNARDLPHPQMWVKLWMLRKPPANSTPDELLEFRISTTSRLLENSLPVDRDYMRRRFRMSLERSDYSSGLMRQAAAIRRCEGRDVALRNVRSPTLVIHGAEDLLMPVAHGFRTAMCIPHSKLVLIENMGHFLHPAFFSTIVKEFVALTKQQPTVRGIPVQITMNASPNLSPTCIIDEEFGKGDTLTDAQQNGTAKSPKSPSRAGSEAEKPPEGSPRERFIAALTSRLGVFGCSSPTCSSVGGLVTSAVGMKRFPHEMQMDDDLLRRTVTIYIDKNGDLTSLKSTWPSAEPVDDVLEYDGTLIVPCVPAQSMKPDSNGEVAES